MPPKKKNSGKKKQAGGSFRFPLFKTLFWLLLLGVAALSILLAIRISAPVTRHQATRPASTHTTSPPPGTRTQAPQQPKRHPVVHMTPPEQYETPVEDFEAKVRAVDAVILQSLRVLDAKQRTMHHKAVEARVHDGQEFFYQNLTIGPVASDTAFKTELETNLAASIPEASLKELQRDPRNLEISIFGEPTHHLYIPKLQPRQPTQPKPQATAGRPRLVIIIDDLGASVNTAARLAALPYPVTFSVLPYNVRARKVAELARRHDRELFLHLPCEPIGYPTKADSGPGTLRVSMDNAALERTLVEDLAHLPEVDGVNNHMGSRLTQDARAMRIVLAHLKGRGKYFVDSVTTSGSAVPAVAKALRMRYYRRHIFLDNTQSERVILLQLQKAESLARRNGIAIAIGHPYPSTLAALEAWARKRDTKIVVCKIQDI